MDKTGSVFMQHHLLAELVEALHIFAALFSMAGLRRASSATRPTTRQLATNENMATHSGLPRDGRLNGLQEKIIEGEGGENGT